MTDDEKERKMKLSIFEEFYLNLGRKSFKFINTIALDNLNTQTNKQTKMNSIQTLVEEISQITLSFIGSFWAKPIEIHMQ